MIAGASDAASARHDVPELLRFLAQPAWTPARIVSTQKLRSVFQSQKGACPLAIRVFPNDNDPYIDAAFTANYSHKSDHLEVRCSPSMINPEYSDWFTENYPVTSTPSSVPSTTTHYSESEVHSERDDWWYKGTDNLLLSRSGERRRYFESRHIRRRAAKKHRLCGRFIYDPSGQASKPKFDESCLGCPSTVRRSFITPTASDQCSAPVTTL